MKTRMWMITAVFAAILFCGNLSFAQAQSAPGEETGQEVREGATDQKTMPGHGGMKGHGMHGGMKGQCPMMQGGGMGKGMMGGGMGQMGCMGCGGLTGSFHQWIKNFMIHKEMFKLSEKQLQQINDTLTGNMKEIIKARSDIQLMRVDLAEAIRKDPTQTKSIGKQMGKVADAQVDLQMKVLDTYSQVLKSLDDNQRKKAEEVLGNPFPMPWEQMGDSGEMSMPPMEGGGASNGGSQGM